MVVLETPVLSMPPVPEISVLDFDVVTFYVGNIKQSAMFYSKLFGFEIVAYQGPETGCKETCSYMLQQHDVRFLLMSALSPDHPIARHVHRHGDGIQDIGFQVEDVPQAYETAVSRGAVSVTPPYTLEDDHGTVQKATIAAYGETTHTFVRRAGYGGYFEPGFDKSSLPQTQPLGLRRVDHAVANVEQGRMNHWVDFYCNVFGFEVIKSYDQGDISTRYSALLSKVVANRSRTIKLPVNEPYPGLRKSQIQEYLDYYGMPGVQHLAIATDDIIETVKALRNNGIEFMTVPRAYYDEVQTRVGKIKEPLTELADLGILVDRDAEGYLLQIFTLPIQDRPTFFFEIIQREGSEGFGKGNFQALFEAIECDQARRGNL